MVEGSLPASREHLAIYMVAAGIVFLVASIFVVSSFGAKIEQRVPESIRSYAKFFYASFLKPHTGDDGEGQQGALESFYKAQVDLPIYPWPLPSNCSILK